MVAASGVVGGYGVVLVYVMMRVWISLMKGGEVGGSCGGYGRREGWRSCCWV